MKSERIQEILVISPFYPPHIGGLQTHADEFNRHLAHKGYNITVLTFQLPPTARAQELIAPGIRVWRFPAWEIIGNYPLPAVWSPRLWRQAARALAHRPHLVISRTRFFISSLIALFLSKMYAVPLVHIEHGSDFVQLSNPLLRYLARLYDLTIGRLVLKQATVTIANSSASQKFVARLSGRTDTAVINRGINKEALQKIIPNQTLRRQYPHQLIVAYIGRLIDGKGLPVLLQALLHLGDQDIHCLIIGDGPARAGLERLATAFHLHETVTFCGDQPWAAAMAYLKSCDVYVNPSYAEGLPTGVIEAALCERLIIATNVGGTPEIIAHNESGLLVNPGNPNELADALRQASSPDLRAALGQKAAAAVASRFNWNHNIDMYHSLLQNLRQRM